MGASSVPSAPPIGSASFVGANVVVSFGLPAEGAPLTAPFIATAMPGGVQASGFNPISFPISTLTAGETYTFSVQAVNASGVGVASEPSNAITIPAAPTGTPFASGQTLRLKFASPSDTITNAKADANHVNTHSAGTAGAIEFAVTAVVDTTVNGVVVSAVTVSNSLDFISDGEIANLTTNVGSFNLVTNLVETDTAVGVVNISTGAYLALLAGASDSTVTYVNGFTGSLWKFEIVVL